MGLDQSIFTAPVLWRVEALVACLHLRANVAVIDLIAASSELLFAVAGLSYSHCFLPSITSAASHAWLGGTLVAYAVAFYLAGDNAKDGALPFRVVLPQTVRQCARSTQFPAAVS